MLTLPAPPVSESEESKSRFSKYSGRVAGWIEARLLSPLQLMVPSSVSRWVKEVHQHGKLFKSSVLLLKVRNITLRRCRRRCCAELVLYRL